MDGWHEDGRRDGLLALSGNVADYNLRITEPYPRGTPTVMSSTPPEPLIGGQEEFKWKQLIADELESHDGEEDGTE